MGDGICPGRSPPQTSSSTRRSFLALRPDWITSTKHPASQLQTPKSSFPRATSTQISKGAPDHNGTLDSFQRYRCRQGAVDSNPGAAKCPSACCPVLTQKLVRIPRSYRTIGSTTQHCNYYCYYYLFILHTSLIDYGRIITVSSPESRRFPTLGLT
jgi:hypothetical protein